MNLEGALDEALSRFYTAPTGLLGQLLTILRFTPEGRAGRPAEALGVTSGTWNAWLLGARGMAGGRAPNAASARRIREAARRAKAAHTPAPTGARVCAFVIWSGYVNQTQHRCVNLDGLYLDAMADEWHGGGSPAAVADLFQEAVEIRYGAPVEFMDADEFEAWGGEAQVGDVTAALHA